MTTPYHHITPSSRLQIATEATTTRFTSDLSEEEYQDCFEILTNTSITKKSDNKFHWPKFKRDFCDTFQIGIDLELTDILYCTSVTLDGIDPKRFAKLLRNYMQKYFEQNVLSRLKSNLIGYQYFLYADEKLSQMTTLESYNLLHRISSIIMKSVNVNECEKLFDLISMYSDYHPKEKNAAQMMYIRAIPKDIIVSFLDKTKLDTDSNALYSLRLGELHCLYVDFITSRQPLTKNNNYVDKGNKKNRSTIGW